MNQAALAPAPVQAEYDVKDLAFRLKISPRTVWRLSDGGLIPGKLRIGKSVRFSRAVIDRWIEQGCPKPKSH
jgi:excisionase family DNA binding protein